MINHIIMLYIEDGTRNTFLNINYEAQGLQKTYLHWENSSNKNALLYFSSQWNEIKDHKKNLDFHYTKEIWKYINNKNNIIVVSAAL